MTERASPPPRPAPLGSLEVLLLGLFLAAWAVLVLSWLHLVALAGNAPIPLYSFFSFASALGWAAGTLYIQRGRKLADSDRRRLRWVYYVGPQGLVYLLRAMAPVPDLRAAPLVPLWAFGVYTVFFLVPILVQRTMGVGGR
ncbi:MAG TPA: hypothetical protein VFE33_02280 [Thermoanaerobaculia bacterium]|nr:hypothetical protein [Thermoanaerobaculia bacterium]